VNRVARTLKRRLSLDRRLSRLLPAGIHACWQHQLLIGRTPDLSRPETFNEKLLWLRLHWRDPDAIRCSDKLAVRAFVEERWGPSVLNQVLAVYHRAEEICPEALPRAFALKVTHASGANVICRDRATLDWPRARKRLQKALARDYYWENREATYRHLPRRILCERYLGNPRETPPDYKFYCFNGEPRVVHVDVDRFTDHRRAFFDLEWSPLDFTLRYPPPRQPVARPSLLEEMKACAARLSRGFPFVRVDLYQVEDRVVFGELTFCPGAGLSLFTPFSADLALGRLLRLPGPVGEQLPAETRRERG